MLSALIAQSQLLNWGYSQTLRDLIESTLIYPVELATHPR